MKKKLLVFLMMICMLLGTMPVFAAEEQRVFDYADLIDEADEAEMHLWIQDMQETWGMDLAFLTTYDTEGMSVEEYGAQFYIEQDLGIGENYDGAIFVLDMGSREGKIVTCGKAIDIYTDYFIDIMWENMVGYLSDGDYYWAFYNLYCDMYYYAQEYQEYLTNPDYVSVYQEADEADRIVTVVLLIGAAFVSFLVAFIGSRMAKSGYNNVNAYTDGRAYLKKGGCRFDRKTDTFASTYTTMVPIPKDDDNHEGSWGGSSSTFSSGGRSFGGGGGKF